MAAVKTSQTTGSSTKGLDDLSLERERDGFDEFTLVFNKDAAMMRRRLVPKLMGRSRLTGDIDGVEGIEPGDTTRTSQMTWADQVGLLQG